MVTAQHKSCRKKRTLIALKKHRWSQIRLCWIYFIQNVDTDKTTICYSKGSINAVGSAGGLVGYITSSNISNSYSFVNISLGSSRTSGVGGLVGTSMHNSTLTNCYAAGSVYGEIGPGGLIGSYNYGHTETSCYYDRNTTGQSDTDRGTPKTTAEMQTQGTFTGWDFTSVWQMSGYPVFRTSTATVTTQAVSSIAAATATGNGNISSLGLPNPSQYGHCWNQTPNPTISAGKTTKGAAAATGAFTSSLTGLGSHTTYYVRAYAANDAGTSYGSEVSFTTLYAAPEVQASSVIVNTGTPGTVTVNWTNGNGSGRAVFMKETAGTITNPSDGTAYTASTNWSSKGTQLGTSAYYCIYSGTGSSVSVTNTASSTVYVVQVFEYNVNGSSPVFNTSTETGNPSDVASSAGSGKALSFDGINQYAYCAAPPAITAPFTVEAWALSNTIGNGDIIGTRQTGEYSFDMKFSITSNIPFFHGDIGTGSTWLTVAADTKDGGGASTCQYLTGKWYHVAYVVTTSGYTIYVNGVQRGSGTFSGTPLFANATHNIYVGQYGAGEYLNGRIDEVRIWTAARTQEEIRSAMCKKLTGSETGLAIYWKFDEGAGTTIANSSTNGTYSGCSLSLKNSPTWVWSGAPVGDAAAYDYTGTNPSDFSAALASLSGDNMTAAGDGSGTVTGIQVYRVDDAALRFGSTSPSGWSMDKLRHWDAFIAGAGTGLYNGDGSVNSSFVSPTYAVTYNYGSHPGIGNESVLAFAKRANRSVDAWTDAGATLNTTAKTLTKSGQVSAEYSLASTSAENQLPVELTEFAAKTGLGSVIITWKTASEINNYGFEVERRVDRSAEWINIGFISGAGSGNSPKNYSYTDKNAASGSYEYRLKQIDRDGKYEYSSIVIVDAETPSTYELKQNFPNPFNPSTTIASKIPVDGFVSIKIFDVAGREAAALVNEK